MLSATLVALCLATNAPSDEVLIAFTSSTCTTCQSMEPTLRRLAGAGVRVDRVDVAMREDLVRQFQVTRVPSYVMWSQGRATARIDGPTSYERLTQMTSVAKPPVSDRFAPPPPLQPNMPIEAPAAPPPASSSRTSAAELSVATTADPRAAAERALRSTVRLRIEDGSGTSVASGTIIDVHGDEALVVTCGHVFRDLRRGGRIWVDLFLPGANQPVAGQLLDFDLQRDIGVISIRPGMAVQAARVGSVAFRPANGEQVFSIGCDRGAAPSIRGSRVTGIDRYQGRPNIEIAGQPVVGRSGGGLFTADGLLIGVCNGADPKDDEGVFAGLATIQWQLENIGQRRLFAGEAAAVATAAAPNTVAPLGAPPSAAGANVANSNAGLATAAGAAAFGAGALAAESATPPPSRPSASPPPGIAPGQPIPVTPAHFEPVAAAQPATGDGEIEIICVVRPRHGAAGDKAETLMIRRPSSELLQRLIHESRSNATNPTSPPPAAPRNALPYSDGPVIRGQSGP